MAIEDIGELRRLINQSGHDWRVREVPAGEAHGLGNLGIDPAQAARAVSLGHQLLEQIREQAPGTLLNRFAQPSQIAELLKLRLRSFDWRSHPGVVGPVRDQGYCGSCVSFATTGLVGAQADIELGVNSLHLSEADLHFCSSHGANCFGWNNHDALDQVRTRGVLPASAFGYMAAFDDPPQPDPASPDGLWLAHCHSGPGSRGRYTITNFTAHTGDDRKTYLRTVGPLVCGFTVYQDFDAYAGGVYRHVTGDVRGGHAVLVVGYSDAESAWICRNSWSAGWGGPVHGDGTGGGFFKIGYGDSGIDGEPFYGCRGVIPPRLFDIRIPLRERVPVRPVPDPGPYRPVIELGVGAAG